jgi:hypothetical protein
MKRFGIWYFLILLHFSCTIRDKKADPVLPPQRAAYAAAYDMISEGQALVKDGDLVLRSGQEFSSQFIRQFSKHDKTYSHSGIIFFENGYPFVFHIVPGNENPDEKLRKDSLARFCNPRKNFGYAIYRYDLNAEEVSKFKASIGQWYAQGVRFDSLFNMKSDDRMYCSEMISKGLAKATGNRIRIATSQPTKNEARFFSDHLHLPLSYTSNLNIVAIDNLFLNPQCRLVRRFDFNPKP